MTCPILIFLKAPVKGQVKTRLARTLGDDAALALYRAFVMDVLEKAGCVGAPILFYTPETLEGTVRDLVGFKYPMTPQKGGDLGEKMARAFETVFDGGADKAVLIGTDVPDVPEDLIRKACEALDGHPAVLGPVTDGGYFLIGFEAGAYNRDLFRDIPWSTEKVFEKTLERMRENGLGCHVLSPWHDVDTEPDLKALAARLGAGQSRAPRTRTCMEAHGTLSVDHHSGSE